MGASGNHDKLRECRKHEIVGREVKAHRPHMSAVSGSPLTFDLSSTVPSAHELIRTPRRVGRRRRSSHKMTGPTRQDGNVARRKSDRATELIQFDNAGALRNEVKLRPASRFSRMIGEPLRAEPAHLLQFRAHAEQRASHSKYRPIREPSLSLELMRAAICMSRAAIRPRPRRV